MSDLSVNFCGLRSPNPFWLASGPPTNTGGQVMRAFDAGWGGAVWKTIGDPIHNTSSRYGAIDLNGVKMMGLNNIELISDRPIAVNLARNCRSKKALPKTSRHCLPDGRIQTRNLARHRSPRRRCRLRRARTEFRLSRTA